ncbi:hypothetical protein G7Y89_g7250 [Cudoniella acicularis]|uniref:Uncharacterized protein n=1 Tax=Cudoniella acicularis TaxID=354080 RepID=A0A8H4RLK1_9HELO|nr:hypothetical protein G7Y89_g7250 [Cudoniella acicularis]
MLGIMGWAIHVRFPPLSFSRPHINSYPPGKRRHRKPNRLLSLPLQNRSRLPHGSRNQLRSGNLHRRKRPRLRLDAAVRTIKTRTYACYVDNVTVDDCVDGPCEGVDDECYDGDVWGGDLEFACYIAVCAAGVLYTGL